MEFSSSLRSQSPCVYPMSPYTYGKCFALHTLLWFVVFSWLREEEFLSGRSIRDEFFDSSLMNSKLSARRMMILSSFGISSTITTQTTQEQVRQIMSCMVVALHMPMNPSLLYLYLQVCVFRFVKYYINFKEIEINDLLSIFIPNYET